MNDHSFRLPGFAITLSEATPADGGVVRSVPRKVPGMRTGTFIHPANGKKFTITKSHLASIKKNFDAKVRGIDIAVDYKHDSADIAAGWVKAIELSEDGATLTPEIDWTPGAEKKLSEKEFRYISADFHPDYQDNETMKKHGPTLLGFGLTNRPVIKGMKPAVELSEPTQGDETMELSEQQVAEYKALITVLAEAKIAPADLGKKLSELTTKVEELTAKVGTSEAALKLAEKEKGFNVMLSEGKVCEAQRKPFLDGDMEAFAKNAKAVNLNEQGTGKEGDGAPAKKDSKTPAQDKVLELAEKLISEKKVSDLGKAVSLVLSENPKLNTEYIAETAV